MVGTLASVFRILREVKPQADEMMDVYDGKLTPEEYEEITGETFVEKEE